MQKFSSEENVIEVAQGVARLLLKTDFVRTRVNTSSFGLNSLKYLATKIWDIAPCDIKSTGNLNSFKEKIRNWEPKGYHRKLCRQYVHGIGYVDSF